MRWILTAVSWPVATAVALPSAVWAAPWDFAPPVDIAPPRAGVYHHLESAGRKNIAVAGRTVGLVWEDNSSGRPQIYAAFRRLAGGRFSAPRRVSTGGEAYEPVIVALGADRFLIAWEQDGAVWARTAEAAGGFGPATQLAPPGSAQASLAVSSAQAIVAVWVQREHHRGRVYTAPIGLDTRGRPHLAAEPLAPDPVEADQLYPSVAVVGHGVTVAWEDRRHGHTVLYYAHAPDGRRFGRSAILNEIPPPRSERYGKGTGVMRVALAAH